MGRSWSFFNGDAVGGTQLAGTQLAWDAVGWDAVGGTRLVGRSWRDAIVPPRRRGEGEDGMDWAWPLIHRSSIISAMHG
jgi:hypothetical protein